MPKSKLIKELVSGEISLENTLYRLIVLAKDIDDKELENWAKNEVQGYKNEDKIPDYREVAPHYIGTFRVGNALYKNSPLPMVFLKKLSPEQQKAFCIARINNPISLIEFVIQEKNELTFPIAPENLHFFASGTNVEIMSGKRKIDISKLIDIVSCVKTKAINILCELEKSFGCLDDMDISNNDNETTSLVIQNIGKIIHCNTNNEIEIGDNNEIIKSNLTQSEK
ncbi:hypothetical protein [Helicobacter pullorum]|uniref:AbiTii domain-containing protein n=1 Tax=Helicobacter pullorum TaxID=35818 RepID=UPI0006CD554C|nr:hypothetical protein [Helicobacter pullorum]KPH51891.1 hypothetical protein HPU229254_05005 [Helicobacter pullorum]